MPCSKTHLSVASSTLTPHVWFTGNFYTTSLIIQSIFHVCFFTLVIYYPIYVLRNRNVYKGASCKYLIITGNTDNLKASSNTVSNVVSYSTQCLWKTVVTSDPWFSCHRRERRLYWQPVCSFIPCGYILTGIAVIVLELPQQWGNIGEQCCTEYCGGSAVGLVRYLSCSLQLCLHYRIILNQEEPSEQLLTLDIN